MNPKAVALRPDQWKSVLISDVAQLHANMVAIECPNEAQVAVIDGVLDGLRSFVHAWHRSQPPVDYEKMGAEITNGQAHAAPVMPADKPKGKPGWPKGKKRGPRKPKVAT